MSERLGALEGENKALYEQLRVLKAQNDDRAYNAEMEKVFAEMERCNRYLEGELRRDEQVKPKRPWWRVWDKG